MDMDTRPYAKTIHQKSDEVSDLWLEQDSTSTTRFRGTL